jgi:mono/diheme cytochrome c family protein
MLVALLAAAAAVGLHTRGTDAQHIPRGAAHPGRDRADAGAAVDGAAGVTATDPLVLDGAERARAEALYERLCAGCHGVAGEGNGPLAGFLVVPPRDFAHQPFKWRSTATGTRPTVADVAQTIGRGVPGAMMPSFGIALSTNDRVLLARFVMSFRQGAPGVPIAAVAVPSDDAATIARGRAVYEQLQCATCHGPELHGDGPSAATLHPPAYDLTRQPPRGGSDAASILRSLRTGLDGSPMPAFDGVVPNDDLAALAVWIASRIPREVASARAPNDPGESHWLDETAPNLTTPVASHLTDTEHAAREAALWTFPLAPQGEGPPQLTPAERSLAPDRCARCHAQQFAQFRTTIHARAMGPGVMGQLVDMPARDAVACQTCHGPLAEQSPALLRSDAARTPSTAGTMMMNPAPPTVANANASGATTIANPDYDAALRPQGIVCAACHLRGRERFGPPSRLASGRLAAMNYPLTTLARYERGDFCAPCHQHTPADSVAGHPILDTVGEWIRSPYFARGIQCQHCHMPDRDHTWRGAHDPDTVRQAVHIYGRAYREGEIAVATVSIENVGAGHAFPGTATPAAVMLFEWLDADGRIVGEPQRDVIQRHLTWTGTTFRQDFDTRILPGAARTSTIRSREANAVSLRVTLSFRPDDFYEGFYRAVVGDTHRSEAGRRLLQQAYAHAQSSEYVVERVVLPVERSSR